MVAENEAVRTRLDETLVEPGAIGRDHLVGDVGEQEFLVERKCRDFDQPVDPHVADFQLPHRGILHSVRPRRGTAWLPG